MRQLLHSLLRVWPSPRTSAGKSESNPARQPQRIRPRTAAGARAKKRIQPWAFLRSDRQALASLRAPRVQHRAAAARLHANQKTVRALASDHGGLKGAFGSHDSLVPSEAACPRRAAERLSLPKPHASAIEDSPQRVCECRSPSRARARTRLRLAARRLSASPTQRRPPVQRKAAY